MLFQTFTELNAHDVINKLDFESLASLHAALEPAKLAVEFFSRENGTLLTADTVLEFMVAKLFAMNTEITSLLHSNLKKCIDERINKNIMQLLRCLKDPSVVPSKNALNYAGKLAFRLFGFTSDEEPLLAEAQYTTSESSPVSLKDELGALLNKDSITHLPKSTDQLKWLKQEFLLYQNTGKRTQNLEKIYNTILSIKRTSTDVECVFSTYTSFCTKIRSRLSNKLLKSLVFLKFF